MPVDKMFETNNIVILVDEAETIQLKEKSVNFKSGKVISYEKLVIGTGSLPIQPKWLKGADLENVFTVPKNKVYLDEMHEKLQTFNKITVIGAGFIGIEISDELKKAGKEVTLVEKLPLFF
jgi:NAD(P)H-nitrite reductase large subunit